MNINNNNKQIVFNTSVEEPMDDFSKEKAKPEKKSEKKEKKQKAKKEKREGEPKKPPSVYFLFCTDKRKENKDKKLSAKKLGEMFSHIIFFFVDINNISFFSSSGNKKEFKSKLRNNSHISGCSLTYCICLNNNNFFDMRKDYHINKNSNVDDKKNINDANYNDGSSKKHNNYIYSMDDSSLITKKKWK